MVYAEHLLFLLETGFWGHSRQRVPTYPTSALGTESLMSVLVGNISPVLSQLTAGGFKYGLCDSTEKRLLQACVWFPLGFTPCAFPSADFALSPFAVTNDSHEYNNMLSPVSPPSN